MQENPSSNGGEFQDVDPCGKDFRKKKGNTSRAHPAADILRLLIFSKNLLILSSIPIRVLIESG